MKSLVRLSYRCMAGARAFKNYKIDILSHSQIKIQLTAKTRSP